MNILARNKELYHQQALRISNVFYGNEVLSAQELAKGYTRPVDTNTKPKQVPEDLYEAQSKLSAQRKFTLIMDAKSVSHTLVAIEDIVQVFFKRQNDNSGTWLSPRPILLYDHSSRTVTVPGQHGPTISAATADTRHAIVENELATRIQEAIDTVKSVSWRSLDTVMSEDIDGDPAPNNPTSGLSRDFGH